MPVWRPSMACKPLLTHECALTACVPSPDPAVPFDFLINGTFLRSSLRKYMRKNGLSGVGTRAATRSPPPHPPPQPAHRYTPHPQ